MLPLGASQAWQTVWFPRTHVNILGVVVHTCSPALVWQKQENLWSSKANQRSLVRCFRPIFKARFYFHKVITTHILFFSHFSFDKTYPSPLQYFLSLGTLVFLKLMFQMLLMRSKIRLCLWLTLASFISLALNFVLFRQQYNVGLYLFFSWMDFIYIVHVFAFWCARQWIQRPANTGRELHPNSKAFSLLPAVSCLDHEYRSISLQLK